MAQPSEAGDRAGPVMSRQHAAGAPSARGLLFTVLGEYVLPDGGPAWTGSVVDLLGRLGIEEKAARQALMRTSADGWLTAERVGRRTRWHLTPEAVDLLTVGARRIFSFRGVQQEWDGQWVTVHVRIPERDRAARHLVRTRLAQAGFGAVSASLWVSTHLERRAAAVRVLEEAGVLADALVFEGSLTGGQKPTAVIAEAFDLVAIEAGYRDFVAEFADPAAADPLARCAELVHAWRRFPWVDPAVPARFLPAGWHGLAAADLLADRHGRWSAPALAEWRRLEGA